MIHQFDQVESTTKEYSMESTTEYRKKEGCLLPIEGNRKKLKKKGGEIPACSSFLSDENLLTLLLVSAGFSASTSMGWESSGEGQDSGLEAGTSLMVSFSVFNSSSSNSDLAFLNSPRLLPRPRANSREFLSAEQQENDHQNGDNLRRSQTKNS